MTLGLTLTLALALGTCGDAARAARPEAIDTLLGRQVAARADAPSRQRTGDGRKDYVLHCAGCHGRDGAGSPAAQVPDLRRLGAVANWPEGRSYLLRVPGVMGSGLDDGGVAAVMNAVLRDLADPPSASAVRPFDAAEVARARQAPLVDVAAERRRLVEAARVQGVAWY